MAPSLEAAADVKWLTVVRPRDVARALLRDPATTSSTLARRAAAALRRTDAAAAFSSMMDLARMRSTVRPSATPEPVVR
ncbi:MAG TPA: hypothetical protein VFH98_06935, partial [Candidatus Limnocylindria bacterium]|nr:hypothetical protein [Candidatus Limnocylindria bacterium]